MGNLLQNKKGGKIALIGLIVILLISLLFVLVVPIIKSDEAPCEILDYDGNLQPCDLTSFLWKRTETTSIYKNLQTGAYTRTIGQGKIFVDDESRRIPNYVNFNKVINMSFNQADGALVYSYKTEKNEYNVTAKIGFVLDITQSTCTSLGWTWLNVGPGYCGVWANQAYSFMSANGIGKDILITDNTYSFKYGINLTGIPANYQDKIVYIGLRLEEVNGLTWDDVVLDSTNQQILIKDKIALGYDDLLADGYTLTLWDKKTVLIGNVSNKANLWLDPVVTLQDADTENLEDLYIQNINPDQNSSTQIMWNISEISDFSSNISNATMCLYANSLTGSMDADMNITSILDYSWKEDDSSLSFVGQTLGVSKILNFNSSSVNTWWCVDIKDIIQSDFDNNKLNTSIRFFDVDSPNPPSTANYEETGPGVGVNVLAMGSLNSNDILFRSKEYTIDTALRPKLEITYTPYIDINSPTPTQTFTQDAPTTIFNVTTAVAMDTCVWSPDSGATNYSLTNTSAFAWNMTNISMVDGSYTNTVFYCNQSDDGTWRTSDTVDFEVDSVNITVCRDLTVSRTYQLQNNIIESVAGHCFNYVNNNIDFDGNWYNVTFTGTISNRNLFDVGLYANPEIYNFNRITTINTQGNVFYVSDNARIFNITKVSHDTTGINRKWMTLFDQVGDNGGDNLFLDIDEVYTTSLGFDTNGASDAAQIKIRNYTLTNAASIAFDFDTSDHNMWINDTVIDTPYTVIDSDSSSIIYLINVTYKNSQTETLTVADILTRLWYFSPQVNDSSGNLENAQVNIYDKDGNLEVSLLTNSTGNIARQELIDYENNGGTKTYNTPHTVNVSKAGYDTNSTIYNLTDENNIFQLVTLELSNVAPTMTLSNPLDTSWSDSLTNTMICNSSDTDGNLKNVTIYTWLNSVEETKNTKSITGSFNSTEWTNLGFISQGEYEWNCYACDDSDACAFAGSNFTLNIDGLDPVISYDTPNENNNTNFSRDWIYVNTTWTETNFQNITFYLYNDTDTVNTTNYSVATTGINFTGLVDNNYSYKVSITDKANRKATTPIRRITIDDTSPVINIVFPADFSSHSNNQSFNINYTVSDNFIGLDSCWYTNDTGLNNFSITCGQNFTQNFSDDTFTYIIYSNDSVNNIGSDSVTFTVATIKPSINLDSPTNNLWINNGTNLYFNYTATDSDGLDTCELWGNWTGTFEKNYTWVKPETAVQNYTLVNISEGNYLYNIWCNDTVDNKGFFTSNFTFHIDETKPNVTHSRYSPSIIYTENDVNIYGNISDTNLDTIWIEINFTGTYQNITVIVNDGETYNYSLSNSNVDNFENISWRWWANDSANNQNLSILNYFEVTNRNPYNLTIFPLNDSFTNTDWFWINFTSTDDDLDTLNFSLYNSTDGVTYSIFNSTTAAFLNFSGFNTTETAVNYFYLTVNDSALQNQSINYTFTIDTINPDLTIDYPKASPVYQCSLTNIVLNYSVSDTNIDYCEFNVSFGGSLSTTHTTIADCSNTTFNVSLDNSVQTLNFNTVDKAGNSNLTTKLIYIDTDNSGCSSDGVSTGGGGGTPVTPEVTFCGDLICQDGKNNRTDRGESFYNCPEDCAVSFSLQDVNLDTTLFNCFDSDDSTDCMWESSPGLLFIFVFVSGLLVFTLLFQFAPKKKGIRKLVYVPPFKKRRRRRF